MEAMAREAKRLGLEYIAITDHTQGLTMTGGSDETKLRKQMAEIDGLNARLGGIRVLRGAEVNIDKDGMLDIDDETLAALDVVGIAVHSHFDLPRAEMTRRIVRAMRNPNADILFHPTGRKIQKREAYDVDNMRYAASVSTLQAGLVTVSARLTGTTDGSDVHACLWF